MTMRKLFETMENNDLYADVCGKNTYGEYEVRLIDPYTKANKKIVSICYETDLDAACGTAIAMAFPANQ